MDNIPETTAYRYLLSIICLRINKDYMSVEYQMFTFV